MSANWTDDAVTISQDDAVLSRVLDSDLVLYNPTTDEVTHLDAIARAVWERLTPGTAFSELVKDLAFTFNSDADKVGSDVAVLLDQLLEKRLIVRNA